MGQTDGPGDDAGTTQQAPIAGLPPAEDPWAGHPGEQQQPPSSTWTIGGAGVTMPGDATTFEAAPAAETVPSSVPSDVPPPPPPTAIELGHPLPPPARRRNRGLVALSAGLVVALLAGAAGAIVLYERNNRDKGATGAETTPTTPTTAPSTDAALPYPTGASILVRVDTGAASGAGRVSKAFSFKPGPATERVALEGTEAGDWLPRWSHDRKSIVVTHRNDDSTNDIVVMNADGTDRRVLVRGVSDSRATFKGDDTRIAYMKKVDGFNQIFTIAVGGGASTQMTSSDAEKDDPFWTHDNKAIAYWVRRFKTKVIYVINAERPKEPGRRITEPSMGPAVDPAISDDDQHFLFTREQPDGSSDIWAIDSDGSNLRRLTENPGREVDPTWSPDGTWFAFTRGPVEKPAVVLLKADGTDETVLTKSGAREAQPCWF